MFVSLIGSIRGGAAALALLGGVGAGPADKGAETRQASMSFEDCVSLVDDVSEELGVAPVSILRTSDMWVMRVDAVDGSLLLSCSRPANRLTLTRQRRGLGDSRPDSGALPAARG
jgi:hypothetical protein